MQDADAPERLVSLRQDVSCGKQDFWWLWQENAWDKAPCTPGLLRPDVAAGCLNRDLLAAAAGKLLHRDRCPPAAAEHKVRQSCRQKTVAFIIKHKFICWL